MCPHLWPSDAGWAEGRWAEGWSRDLISPGHRGLGLYSIFSAINTHVSQEEGAASGQPVSPSIGSVQQPV